VSLHTECSLAFIMANPKIKVKRSSGEGKVPAVSQLERGELAVNSYDGKVYILKDQFSVGIATTGSSTNPCGTLSFGKISGFTRSSTPISIGVTGFTASTGLSTFPILQRRGTGLRDTGGLSK